MSAVCKLCGGSGAGVLFEIFCPKFGEFGDCCLDCGDKDNAAELWEKMKLDELWANNGPFRVEAKGGA